MARIWKEERKGHWSEHFDLHGYHGLPGHDVSPNPKLVPVWTYFVEVCGFTFRFGSVAQIEVVLNYYTRKVHPSSRLETADSWEHDVGQRWFERFPGYLRKEPKRQKVVKALRKALIEFQEFKGRFPTTECIASNLPIIRRGA